MQKTDSLDQFGIHHWQKETTNQRALSSNREIVKNTNSYENLLQLAANQEVLQSNKA